MMTYTPVYERTMDAIIRTGRYVSSCGGTRSGKTIANLQAVFELAAQDTAPTITSVVSETFPHLKRGAIRDFPMAVGDAFNPLYWNKSESIYTFPHNGAQIEFFSADAPGKVHGPARDRLFLNEVQNIPHEIARQLFIRTRGLIILDYNPTASFWCNETIEPREDCITVHSTYKDNYFLTPEQVAEIEANKGDSNWWKVYGLGEFGSLEGVIYDFDLVDAMPSAVGRREVWGMDFGFTHDPTAIVRVVADTGRREAWVEQKAYRTGMLNRDITAVLREAGIPRHVRIWADAAEPKAIAEIGHDTGLQVVPSNKTAPSNHDRLTFQLQWMQGWRLHFTKGSVDLIKEGRNYTWAKDRDGRLLNVPIDTWNHALDAMRYAIYSEFAASASGNYNLSFR